MSQKKAVVLVSGGLDSTTVLAIARSQGYTCYTISFDYGQRHRAELLAASRTAKLLGSEQHKVVRNDSPGTVCPTFGVRESNSGRSCTL